MTSVGIADLKNQLSDFVDRAGAGEEIVITKHGKVVARLVSPAKFDRERSKKAFEQLMELRKGVTLGDLNWKDLRDEGRK
jgi:prevent-host-death family protein